MLWLQHWPRYHGIFLYFVFCTLVWWYSIVFYCFFFVFWYSGVLVFQHFEAQQITATALAQVFLFYF